MQMAPQAPSLGIALLFNIIGLAVFGGGIWSFADTREFLALAKETPGTVVELIASTDDDGTSYYPVVSFQDTSGTQQRVQTSMGSNPPAHDVGESVTVLFDPAKPQKMRIKGFWGVWGLTAFLLGFGTLWESFSFVLLSKSLRNRQVIAENTPVSPGNLLNRNDDDSNPVIS